MTTTVSIRTEQAIKDDAEKILEELGLNLSSAVNIFLRQVIRENGIPFPVKLDVPNADTKAAIEEGNRLVADKRTKRYSSVEELRAELDV